MWSTKNDHLLRFYLTCSLILAKIQEGDGSAWITSNRLVRSPQPKLLDSSILFSLVNLVNAISRKKIDDVSKMLYLLSSFKPMFFKTKSKKSCQNKYGFRLNFRSYITPEAWHQADILRGRLHSEKLSPSLSEPFCLQMNYVTAGSWFPCMKAALGIF